MGKNEHQTYLKAIRSRYRYAARKSKTANLDEFFAICAYYRKYSIRLLIQRVKHGGDCTPALLNRLAHYRGLPAPGFALPWPSAKAQVENKNWSDVRQTCRRTVSKTYSYSTE